MLSRVLAPIFEDLSQIERLFEIKPPLGSKKCSYFISVVNEKNGMVTGRQFSKLVTIKTDFDGSTLTLNAEGRETIQATIPMVGETVYTEVFGMKCEGIDMGPEIGAWIAEHLEKSHLKLRLVYHDYSDKSSTRQLQVRLFDFPRFNINFV